MIQISPPEYLHIRWMNDKYLRNIHIPEWYYWKDFNWIHMTSFEAETIEWEYQKANLND